MISRCWRQDNNCRPDSNRRIVRGRSSASMRAARRVVSATLTRIVNGEHVGTTMPDALDMFHQWEAMR